MPKIVTEADRLERQNTFIKRAKSIHGDRFDYSKVYYINKFSKVCILLGKKELWQRPQNHFQFKGTHKNGLERKFPNDMSEYHWKEHKRLQKKRHRHKYWLKEKEMPKYRDRFKTRRVFCKVRTYKCVFCNKKFKRKEYYIGYIGKYCSYKCLIEEYNKKLIDEKLKHKYLLVLSEFRKKKEVIEQFILKKDAVKLFKKLVLDNTLITLPQKYVIKKDKAVKINNEILLIERNEDSTISLKEKNELGKLINTKVKSTSKFNKLIIIDKHPYHSEQKFNIMGNDDKIDVNHIINNILLLDDDSKQIMVYDKNLIIKKENDIELILSEHQYIIMDLYNYLQSYCKRNKLKHIMFMGMIDGSPMLVSYYDDKIKNLQK